MKQVKTTLKEPLLSEFDALCAQTGLNPSALLKLSIRRLAAAELYQNQSASPGNTQKEAA